MTPEDITVSTKQCLFSLISTFHSYQQSVVRTIENFLSKTAAFAKNYSYSNTLFISFHITTATSLCMSQWDSFNQNDLIVLLNWNWSHFTNKFSLIKVLSLFRSEARAPISVKNMHSQVNDQILLIFWFQLKLFDWDSCWKNFTVHRYIIVEILKLIVCLIKNSISFKYIQRFLL